MPEMIEKIEALGKLQSMYIQIECACGDGNPVAKGVRKAYKAIERMPAIKPEERHGRWSVKMLDIGGGDKIRMIQCSECSRYANMKFDFCPNCGTDMREVIEDAGTN